MCCPLQGDDHICSSALSSCGGWLVFSTICSVRLYRVQLSNNTVSLTKVPMVGTGTFTDGVENELLVYFSYFSSQVSKLPRILCWAHQLCFSADSSRLFAAGARSSVHVFSLSQSECKHIHTLRPKSGQFTHTHTLSHSLPPSLALLHTNVQRENGYFSP